MRHHIQKEALKWEEEDMDYSIPDALKREPLNLEHEFVTKLSRKQGTALILALALTMGFAVSFGTVFGICSYDSSTCEIISGQLHELTR